MIVRDGYETKAYDKNNKVYFGDLAWYASTYYRGGFQSIFGFVGDWTSEELTAIGAIYYYAPRWYGDGYNHSQKCKNKRQHKNLTRRKARRINKKKIHNFFQAESCEDHNLMFNKHPTRKFGNR